MGYPFFLLFFHFCALYFYIGSNLFQSTMSTTIKQKTKDQAEPHDPTEPILRDIHNFYICLLRELKSQESVLWNALIKRIDHWRKMISNRFGSNIGVIKMFATASSNEGHCLYNLIRFGDMSSLLHNETGDKQRNKKLASIELSILFLCNSFECDLLIFPLRFFASMNPAIFTFCLTEYCKRDWTQFYMKKLFVCCFIMERIIGVNDCNFLAAFGALMVPVFGSESISSYLQTTCKKTLIAEIKEQYHVVTAAAKRLGMPSRVIQPTDSFFRAVFVDMKKWQKDLKTRGMGLILQIDPRHVHDCYSSFLCAKAYLECGGQYLQMAFNYFSLSIIDASSLYLMILSLRYLCDICFGIEQYVVALSLLNKAYELCTFYELPIIPTFVNKIYAKKRKKIKKKLGKLLCICCGESGKLCCTACMSAFYCSKSCQKRDWKSKHRKQCANKWSLFYKNFKDLNIF